MRIEVEDSDGGKQLVDAPDDAIVGKGAQSEIRLSSWRVSKEHARLFKTPSGILVEDMGAFGGVTVNGQRIDIQHGPLKSSDVIGVGPYKLRVLSAPDERGTATGPAVSAAHAQSRSDTVETRNRRASESLQESRNAALRAQAEIYQREVPRVQPVPVASSKAEDFAVVLVPSKEEIELEFEWRKKIHDALLEKMDLRRQDVSRMTDEQLKLETEKLIKGILQDKAGEIPLSINKEELCLRVLNEAVGLGPLEELLGDDSVSEVMVNRHDEIFIERGGQLQKYPIAFTNDKAVMGVIERIVAPLGRRIDESSPMVDARLKDGSRVNAIIPPLALKGPTITIRKFSKKKLNAGDLVKFGSIDEQMAEFLKVCVESRKNIVVSGGTGSGKTTLLNILSNFIPRGERIITVEDAAELQLSHEHLINLESRPSNVEGRGGVSIRELVKNTLRMRPDRIVVGECRGAEALDMLQAMNTGHEGSLTTLHANTPRDALARLETMILMAGMELPLSAIREQIASAVDIIVQQTRFHCGSRRVTYIVEITGIESGKLQMQELFRFIPRGHDPVTGKTTGFFTGCNMVPSFYEELSQTSHGLDVGIFKSIDPERLEELLANRMGDRGNSSGRDGLAMDLSH